MPESVGGSLPEHARRTTLERRVARPLRGGGGQATRVRISMLTGSLCMTLGRVDLFPMRGLRPHRTAPNPARITPSTGSDPDRSG